MVPSTAWKEGVSTDSVGLGTPWSEHRPDKLPTCCPQPRAPAHGLFMQRWINCIDILIINNNTLITAVAASLLTRPPLLPCPGMRAVQSTAPRGRQLTEGLVTEQGHPTVGVQRKCQWRHDWALLRACPGGSPRHSLCRPEQRTRDHKDRLHRRPTFSCELRAVRAGPWGDELPERPGPINSSPPGHEAGAGIFCSPSLRLAICRMGIVVVSSCGGFRPGWRPPAVRSRHLE